MRYHPQKHAMTMTMIGTRKIFEERSQIVFKLRFSQGDRGQMP